LTSHITTQVSGAIKRRILFAQSMYALGALLCIFSTYLSIAFIVLMQLHYAIVPRFRGLPWESPNKKEPERQAPAAGE